MKTLSRLEVLDLAGTPIDSLEFVTDLPALRRLQIEENRHPGVDLSPLIGHPTLERLTIISYEGRYRGWINLPGIDVRSRRAEPADFDLIFCPSKTT